MTLLNVFYVLLIVLVGRRHTWARWTLLAFTGLGWIAMVTEPSATETPLATAINLLVLAADTWAVYLLFSGRGAQWFRN